MDKIEKIKSGIIGSLLVNGLVVMLVGTYIIGMARPYGTFIFPNPYGLPYMNPIYFLPLIFGLILFLMAFCLGKKWEIKE